MMVSYLTGVKKRIVSFLAKSTVLGVNLPDEMGGVTPKIEGVSKPGFVFRAGNRRHFFIFSRSRAGLATLLIWLGGH